MSESDPVSDSRIGECQRCRPLLSTAVPGFIALRSQLCYLFPPLFSDVMWTTSHKRIISKLEIKDHLSSFAGELDVKHL